MESTPRGGAVKIEMREGCLFVDGERKHGIRAPMGFRAVDEDTVVAYLIDGMPDRFMAAAAEQHGDDPYAATRVLIADVDDQTPRWCAFREVFRYENFDDLRCDELDRRDLAHYEGREYQPVAPWWG